MGNTQNCHILVLSSWYPNDLEPSSGNFIQRFARWQSKHFKVSVIFIKSKEGIPELYFDELQEDNFHQIIGYYPKPKGLFSKFRQVAAYKHALDEAMKRLKSKPDLIHAHVSYPKGKEFEYVSRKLKTDFILHEHSSDFSDFGQKSWTPIKKRIIISTLKKAKIVLAVSPFLEKQILKVEPYLVHAVLPLPVDLELFYPEPNMNRKDRYTFIHVSGLDERFKNVKGIVEAFSRVRRHHKNAFLKIVTDGNSESLSQFMEENNLSEGVEILENLSFEQIAIEYRSSDCFVLFSEFETYSCVLIEALSSGLQVITTQVGIAHDLDPRVIHIVPRKDIHALATTMEDVLRTVMTESKRNALVNEAKKFAYMEVLAQLKIIYSQVLKRYDLFEQSE
jgi:glycosyltransferase involved in cell wall biosynthesis